MDALNLLNRFEIGVLLTSLARKANKKHRKEIITLKKKEPVIFYHDWYLLNQPHA
jgi:hypothetical protein